jgi:ApbE superfamily uncharacterized protein (UPF0280 family)
MTRARAAMLPDGRRLHLQDGPIDLVIEAFGSPEVVRAAHAAAVRRFDGLLDELCAELPLLRAPARPGGAALTGVVARRMYEAVAAHAGTTDPTLQSSPPTVPPPGVIPGLVPGIQATVPVQRRVRSGRGMDPRHKAWDDPERIEQRGDEARSGALASGAPPRSARRPSSGAARHLLPAGPGEGNHMAGAACHLLPRAGEGEAAARLFITPMAAVAGAVADEVLAAMLAGAAGALARAYVNNGGDIALFLARGESFAIGLVDRPDRPSLESDALFARSEIGAEDRIGGIATSGWRGRSFSLGIADAVTVLAKDAAAADAAATVIANAVDLPGHPAVVRMPASAVQPDSDLGDRLVTRGVGALSVGEVDEALAAGVAAADDLVRRGLIAGAALHLAGQTRVAGRRFAARAREIEREDQVR